MQRYIRLISQHFGLDEMFLFLRHMLLEMLREHPCDRSVYSVHELNREASLVLIKLIFELCDSLAFLCDVEYELREYLYI